MPWVGRVSVLSAGAQAEARRRRARTVKHQARAPKAAPAHLPEFPHNALFKGTSKKALPRLWSMNGWGSVDASGEGTRAVPENSYTTTNIGGRGPSGQPTLRPRAQLSAHAHRHVDCEVMMDVGMKEWSYRRGTCMKGISGAGKWIS